MSGDLIGSYRLQLQAGFTLRWSRRGTHLGNLLAFRCGEIGETASPKR